MVGGAPNLFNLFQGQVQDNYAKYQYSTYKVQLIIQCYRNWIVTNPDNSLIFADGQVLIL